MREREINGLELSWGIRGDQINNTSGRTKFDQDEAMVPFSLSRVAVKTDTFQSAVEVKAFLRAISISSVKDIRIMREEMALKRKRFKCFL